jgi:hypothetical protein
VSSEENPSTAEAPAHPAKPGLSATAVALALVLVAVLGAAMFYLPSIQGWIGLEGWSRGRPLDTVARFSASLTAGDAAAISAQCPGCDIETDAAGKATRIKPPNPRGMGKFEFQDTAQVAARQPATDAKVRYAYDKRVVNVYATTEGGGRLRYDLRRVKGQWVVAWFCPAGEDENW